MEFTELIGKEPVLIQERANHLATLLEIQPHVLVKHYKGHAYVVTGFGTAEGTC